MLRQPNRKDPVQAWRSSMTFTSIIRRSLPGGIQKSASAKVTLDLIGRRKRDLDGRPGLRRGRDCERAAMKLHNALRDGQAEAET